MNSERGFHDAAPESWVGSVYHPPGAEKPWRLEDLLDCRANYYSLGRWALADALKVLGVGPGDAVLVPGYICRDLLSALHAVGAVPAFYPVSERLELAADPDALPHAKAVVAVDYFGFPQDLRPFREYCRRTGARLIEDNAHGLFSRDADGLWLGLRGDLGIFSLRKTVALPNGAALAARREVPFVFPPPLPCRAAGGLRWRLKRGFRRLTASWDAGRTFRLLERLRALRGEGKGGEDGRGGVETSIPMPPEPCAELGGFINVADPQAEVRRRRALYEFCQDALQAEGVRPVFPELPRNTAPYAYPFYPEPGRIPRIRERLAGHGLRCLTWPDLPRAIESGAPAHYRNVRVVYFLW